FPGSGPGTVRSETWPQSVHLETWPRIRRIRDLAPPSEGDAGGQAERARAAALADEPRRRQLRRIGEGHRDVARVERIADPALDEQQLAAPPAAEVGQRIRVLPRQVQVVVLERAVEDHLG